MSVRDYLHEKAEESRHNEMSAHLMFIAGAIFFIGGILETITATQTPDWFLFFPYEFTTSPASILGMGLTICGAALLVYGLAAGFFHSRDRAWYMQELHKAHSPEAGTLGNKKRRKRNNTKTKNA